MSDSEITNSSHIAFKRVPEILFFEGENGCVVLRIGPGNEVWVNPEIPADDAARAFWDAVRRLAPWVGQEPKP